MFRLPKQKGQGLLEFAIILPALLMIVLSIIEGALLFQSYLAIQHAAREAARYAVTYQPPITYSEAQGKLILEGKDPGPPKYRNETDSDWHARRVALIKQRALDQAMGIRIVYPALDETSFAGLNNRPGFFGVRVWGFPAADAAPVLDHPSLQGLPVRIQVVYRWEALDPLIKALFPNGVLLRGEATMINEGIQVSLGSVAPPEFPPPETIEAPTATPPGGPTSTPETPPPEPTFTPTPVTPTPTPDSAYIILSPEKNLWLEEGIPNGTVEIHNHPDPGPYTIYWTDNCGQKWNLGLSITTSGQSGSASMPDPSSVASGFSYLSRQCGALQQDHTYMCTLSSNIASTQIPVYVPVSRPDLVISRMIIPDTIRPGEQITVGVVISNAGPGVVSGTFDIDIYVDPSHTPILQGQPGLGTAGGSSPKQWHANNMAPGQTATLYYVLVFPGSGDYELWSQVDTSDLIDEEDDTNNVAGPFDLSLLCSSQCDNFDGPGVDPKWIKSRLGNRQGDASASITADGQLRIEGTGYSVWVRTDGMSFLYNQGPYPGNFDMSVKVLDYPREAWGKAGLMVRESTATGERYVAIVVTDNGGPQLQVIVRSSDDTEPQEACTRASLPGQLFDGIDSNGEGIWLRIVREGQQFTMYSSGDGKNWSTESCMQPMFSDFADPAVPGIWMAPYSAQSPRSAEYDEFRLCPEGSTGKVDVRPRPPLLRECGNVLTNSDFEPLGDLSPWVTGEEIAAVVGDSGYSADRDGRLNHGSSMLFKCDSLHTWPYEPYHPWAYQNFTVPDFISTTQQVTVEMDLSLYYLVPPASTGRTEGRAEDQLRVTVGNSGGADLMAPTLVTNGSIAQRDRFHPFSANLASQFTLQDYVGQNLTLRFDAPNINDEGDSYFYIDQVRCNVCTTVKPPPPEPGKVHRLGGKLQVILAGQPTEMEGIDVWAIQLPDGITPPSQLDFQATYSIQDSTYNFYNLNPGTYRIYAEVWVSGNMYSAVMTISANAGDVITNADMNLL